MHAQIGHAQAGLLVVAGAVDEDLRVWDLQHARLVLDGLRLRVAEHTEAHCA